MIQEIPAHHAITFEHCLGELTCATFKFVYGLIGARCPLELLDDTFANLSGGLEGKSNCEYLLRLLNAWQGQ